MNSELLPFLFIAAVVVLGLILRSAWFKGRVGESKVNLGLDILLDRDVYRLLKDVTLPISDETTQIDHLVVSPYGIFVIETKNMKGWIFGRPNQAQWTQQIYHHKQRFQNPLRQNYKHVRAVQELLGLAPDQVHNVVVFVGGCTLKTPMPPEVVHGVTSLAKFIKSKRVPVFAEDEVPRLVEGILDNRLQPGMRTKSTHVDNVKRRTPSLEVGVGDCPRCGGAMAVRTNRRSGERFLGCRRYPECRGTRSLP